MRWLVLALWGVILAHTLANQPGADTPAPENNQELEKCDPTADHCWDVNTQKGVIRGQSLRVTRIQHPNNTLHSCFSIKCSGRHCPPDAPCKGNINQCGRGSSSFIEVCYPAVVVIGLPKCGTSAIYDLMAKAFNGVVMAQKENCPSTRRRPHWEYFNSLPRMESLVEDSVVIDGCIDITVNMKMRNTLRQPKTHYVVMVRNYADMLWSSYNFWCKREYDTMGLCGYEKWADPTVHLRSPELFHELIDADRVGKTGVVQPFYKPLERPCVNAGGFYSEFLDQLYKIQDGGRRNRTIVLASEELDASPVLALVKIALKVGCPVKLERFESAIANFAKIRINSQEKKGTNTYVSMGRFKPGLYNISGYRPILPATRDMLDKCWVDDCKKIAKVAGYAYAACKDS
jgi:hypothetical protein